MPSIIDPILMYSARCFGRTNGKRLMVLLAISMRLRTSISSGRRPCIARTVSSMALSMTVLLKSGVSIPSDVMASTVRDGSLSTRARYRRTSCMRVSPSSRPTIP